MANRHILALDVPDTACENVLRIADVSVYLPTGISGPSLSITPPNSDEVIFTDDDVYLNNDVTVLFNKVYTADLLGISDPDQDYICPLVDGLYVITYSICPNTEMYVTYNHLRTTISNNRYYAELCRLQLQACEPTVETKEKLSHLRYIKMLIDAAKAKVEYCNATQQGLDMFAYAVKLLDKFDKSCNSNCNC